MQVQFRAAWHAALMVAGRGDGLLEVWDLLDRSHEPILTMLVAGVALTGLAFSLPVRGPGSRASSQQLLAIGLGLLLVLDMAQVV